MGRRFWGAPAASLFFWVACRKTLRTFDPRALLRPLRCRLQAADDYRLAACAPQTARESAYGFVARINAEGPGVSSLRTFLNPASSSQLLISLKLKASPRSVLTSICTA